MLNSTYKVQDLQEFKPFLLSKKRIMGLDLGKKRIGVSVSTLSLNGALPLKTISEDRFSELLNLLKKIIIEYDIKGIIFGLPKNMDGSEGPSSQSAKDLAINLSKDITENITLWDERLSSQGAFNLSNELAINSSKKVKKLDENSAQFILQGALDYYHKKNT